jgi:hypothetical protein
MDLKPLTNKEIISKLKEIINGKLWQILITLTTGDIIIGDFFPEWQKKSTKNSDKIWFPESSKGLPENFCSGLVFENGFKMTFNSPKGTTHGDASLIDVPLEKIANIKKLNWENPDIRKNGLKNVPNPLAVIIDKCNLRVAEKNSLKICRYCEMALARENVGDEGISFTEDELIYIDVDFFNNSQGSVDMGPVSFGSSLGAYNLANIKLRDSVLQKTLRKVSDNLVEPVNFIGTLCLPDQEITTTLEGDDCFVILCQMEDNLLPILLKRRLLLYPFEYMSLIRSKLVFYGELKQIPIEVKGDKYDKVLFARAIGFMKNKCS